MIGIKSLDNDFSWKISAATTSGNLRYQLKSSFRGSKVRHIEGSVGGDNAHQCYEREVMTFGNHLRADKNVNFPLFQRLKYFFLSSLPGSSVGIHSLNTGFRKNLFYFFFQLLRADSVTQYSATLAGRA